MSKPGVLTFTGIVLRGRQTNPKYESNSANSTLAQVRRSANSNNRCNPKYTTSEQNGIGNQDITTRTRTAWYIETDKC